MNNKIALASLAMDLKRMAIGYHSKSFNMANRFFEEALKRRSEIDYTTVRPYVAKLLKNLEKLPQQKEKDKIAEDALLHGILFQNAAIVELAS